jgi:microcystin-dependent protein
MSFPVWNSDPSWNKITSSYFRDNIDLSGNFIIRNGTIRSPNNTIEFDDTFGFINFTNASFFGQLKNTFNSVEYDVGLQCEKVDEAIGDIETLSPIVSDTAFKCTNFYYDQASNSTVWSGLLTCPIASIASTALANTTRFIEGTGNQTVGGIKRFTSNIRIDAGMQLSAGTITLTNANLQKIQYLSTVSSDVQTQINTLTTNSVSLSASNVFTGATNQFSNTLRLDGALNLNANALVVPNTTLQKIQYLSTVSSDVQTQINTLTTNSVSLSASNIFTGATNQFSNTLRLDGALNLNANALVVPNTTLQKIQYLSTVSSDIQTQINNLNGVSLTASNVFTGATNQFSNSIRLDGTLVLNANTLTLTNDNLTRIQYLSGVSSSVSTSITNINTSVSTLNTKTTKMSYMSVGGINTTTILDGLISQVLSFTTSLNNITPTVFGYLSGVSSSIQTQLNNLATQLNPTGSIIMSPLSDIQTTSSNKYLLCNGQLVSRTTYATLFGKFGTTFGVGDGSTTFGVPNYQGLFLRGMDSQTINSIVYTGVSVSSPQQDSIQNHTHLPQTGSYLQTTNSSSATGGYSSVFPATKPDTSNFANTGLMATGRNNTSETRPVNLCVYYYVKT